LGSLHILTISARQQGILELNQKEAKDWGGMNDLASSPKPRGRHRQDGKPMSVEDQKRHLGSRSSTPV
jgi:hypothetical protein